MNKIIKIWGRDFDLPVTFEQYENQEILDLQLDTFKKFNLSEEMQNKSKEAIIKRIKNMGIEKEVENIFAFVKPIKMYVPREKNKKVIGIICAFKLDMEHGLGIVFENNSFKALGEEDILY